jgi:hypothetical protein
MFKLFKRRRKGGAAEATKGDDTSAGEADEVMFIKAKCEAGTLSARRLSDPSEDHAAQLASYSRIRDECIARADKISDEFYRGAALHQIIDMCVAAGDLAVARALLVAVQDDFLRDRIFESAPMLRD